VAGPTGAGKSLFAATLACRIGGEVVGADAFQIFSGLPILTAQPTEAVLRLVPHHLIGFLDWREDFDAARYARMCWQCIGEIQARGNVPVVTGGTGLYLKALTHGLAEMPRSDPGMRARLGAMPLDEVLAMLAEKDPSAPGQIDTRNPVRVRRALEIVLLTGRPLAASRGQWQKDRGLFRGVVLTRGREDLKNRIATNVDAMFSSGVVEEVRAAAQAGPGAVRAIGFREIKALIGGEISEQACREAIVAATHRYAKRQLTWAHTQFNFPTLDLRANVLPEEAVESALALMD
jgi:tRNA dimethylallyltransferase